MIAQLTTPVQLIDFNFFVTGPAHCPPLDACGKLGGHHFSPINPATINDEVSVADGVDHPLLLSLSVDMGSNTLQDHDVMLADNLADLALDIRQALHDQRRLDQLTRIPP